jgi:hypothetical protein
VPDDYFKDIECKVTVITTGEQKNKAVILASLAEIVKSVIPTFNPTTGEFGAFADPTLSKLYNQMIELSNTGISPISLGKGAMPTRQKPQAPAPSAAPAPVSSPALATK